MATNTKIKEFIIDDHDIVNGLFSYSGSIPVTAGTVLTFVSSSGYRTTDGDLVPLAFVGTNSFSNTVSTRWGLGCQVRDCGSGDSPLGLLRYDIREYDENGQRYQFYPQKWAENEWIASGQGLPILTKGFVFISGLQGTPTAGAVGYASGAGVIAVGTAANVSSAKVGKFWGATANNGLALFQIIPNI